MKAKNERTWGAINCKYKNDENRDSIMMAK